MKLAFIGSNDLSALETDAQFASDHDFRGLEFNWWGNFNGVTADTVKQMREILDSRGVGCSALGLWGWNHLSPDAAERATAHEMLNRGIEFAKIIGAKVLITGGGHIPGAGINQNANEFLKVFPPFLDRIGEAGLQPAFYGVHGASFFTSIEAYEAVWDKLPQVGIKYDPANWRHANLDYIDVVHRHGDKVTYVHIKEHLYHKGELASQPPAGMGDIEWGKVMAFLYEHDYDGYLSMEPHGDVWGWGPRACEMKPKMLLLSQKYLGQFLL
ncbi:MAG: sugar phosphate isomerase/epimerase family protein [Armatimonadota bacterium]